MNAQSLFVGEHYAWRDDRRKGVFHTDAVKVRVMGVSQKRKAGNLKFSTSVKVFVIETERMLEVPAREIIDYWDSYVDEREHVRREKELRDAAVTKRRLKEEIKLQMAQSALRMKGVHPDMVLVSIGAFHIDFKMNKETALDWLGITEQAVDDAVSRRMDELAIPDPDRANSVVPYDL